ncbi:MAG: hypothetical protein P1U74_04935 [Legionellaceae bacterium]|nr:hypothetical protein [Legionellaceae bacterium]
MQLLSDLDDLIEEAKGDSLASHANIQGYITELSEIRKRTHDTKATDKEFPTILNELYSKVTDAPSSFINTTAGEQKLSNFFTIINLLAKLIGIPLFVVTTGEKKQISVLNSSRNIESKLKDIPDAYKDQNDTDSDLPESEVGNQTNGLQK